MKVLSTFNLGCVSTQKGLLRGLTLKDQPDLHEFHLTDFSEVLALKSPWLIDLQWKSVGRFLCNGNIGLILKLFVFLKIY